MPANTLLRHATPSEPTVLLASALLLYAIEHCAEPAALGHLDERLEEIAGSAALEHHARLLRMQGELERPLSGLTGADATRKRALSAILRRAGDAGSIGAILSHLDPDTDDRGRAEDDEAEEDVFDHRPDEDWQQVEQAAYEGALRFPPARTLPFTPMCVERATFRTARWERRRIDAGEPGCSLARLRAVARTAGRQCAIDAWRAWVKSPPPAEPSPPRLYGAALSQLSRLATLKSPRDQAVILGDLVAWSPERSRHPTPHRQWLGFDDDGFRVARWRARQRLAELLEERPTNAALPQVMDALAPAARLLAEGAIRVYGELGAGDGGGSAGPSRPLDTRGEDRPRPASDNHQSPEATSMSTVNFEETSALALILRSVLDSGERVPDDLLRAAIAGTVDGPARDVLFAHAPERVNQLRAELRSSVAGPPRRRARGFGSVIVTLVRNAVESARQLVVDCSGDTALPQICLSDVEDTARDKSKVELLFFDAAGARQAVLFNLRESPDRPPGVDLAFLAIPSELLTIGLTADDGRNGSWAIDVARAESGLDSSVIRGIPPGRYGVWAVGEDQRHHLWSLDVRLEQAR